MKLCNGLKIVIQNCVKLIHIESDSVGSGFHQVGIAANYVASGIHLQQTQRNASKLRPDMDVYSTSYVEI